MRSSTARMRGDCHTNCTPTRMALASRSRPSGLSLCSRRQRMMTKPAASDSTALSTNTQALPALAISAPATSGPMMRDAFIATPLSASAAGNCVRGTSSGTIAANTGQRIARPMPLAKVSASSSGAVIHPARRPRTARSAIAGHPELRRHEVAPPVQDVGQRAAGQAQQEHRQRRGRLHQRHPQRRARRARSSARPPPRRSSTWRCWRPAR